MFYAHSRSVCHALALPAVGSALVLPAGGYATLVLLHRLMSPPVGYARLSGPRARVGSSSDVFLLLTTGPLAVVPSLIPSSSVTSRCGSLRFRGSLLSPPTPLRSIGPLRDCCFAVDALAPRIGSLQERVLLTMRIGFSFARYFFFTCSAAMSVSLFTGCVHPHKVRVFVAASDSRDNNRIPDVVACFAVSVGVHPFALRSAAIVLLVLLCLLHCYAAVLWRCCRCCVSCPAVRASPHL